MDHETAMQRLLEARDRITELKAALREARGMLKSCDFDDPDVDKELQASWGRGLAKIDAALSKSE